MLDVDPLGFDLMDRKLLEAVIHRFDGGPVGLDNVAAAIGEERTRPRRPICSAVAAHRWA